MDIEGCSLRYNVLVDIAFLLALVVGLGVADVGIGDVDISDTGLISVVSCHLVVKTFLSKI